MGGVIDGRLGISSTFSPHQSSDLEKTQAELRQTFTAAEKFRRELEFLQKGGNPLDLKTWNSASVSVQSTSLIDQHPEQFVTSETKGSFGATASPHGDSVESSGRLGAPSVCELNSADNLMLFDGDNKFCKVERRSVHPPTNNITPSERYSELGSGQNARESGDSAALELPKKSYKRRIRSRPNRDGARSSSTDAALSRGGQSFFPFHHASRDVKGLAVAANQEWNSLSNSNSQNPRRNQHDQLLKHDTQESLAFVEPESLEGVEQENLAGSQHPPCVNTLRAKNLSFSGQTNGYRTTEGERKSMPYDGNHGEAIPTKGLDSQSSCTRTSQSLDVNNENELSTSLRNTNHNGTMEQNLASNEVPDMEGNGLVKEKEGKLLNIANNNNFNSCHRSHIEVGSVLMEEERLKRSESAWRNELKNPVLTEGVNSEGGTAVEQNTCPQNNLNLITKEHDDSILKEARIIEAKRKRIAELSVGTLPQESHRKSHWGFVLEEMSWLANDFAQERLWKVTAAAQISRRVAFTSQIRFQQQISLRKQKEVAQTLARAVMEFWHMIQVKCKELELECLKTDSKPGLQGYAMRFLEYSSSDAQYNAAQAPPPPDMISDVGIIDISWEDNLTEENLFYTVPPGAIEAYRKSIESHLLHCESGMQEEVDMSGYDAVADKAFEEDDGETRAYYLPGAFEGSKSSKAAQKRRKNFKFYTARSYETGADLPFMQSVERNIGTQPSILSGKRLGSSLNVSIPTKRVRTASRQRVLSPFNAGTSGCIQAPNRTDASSGDTNSFPDEQSTVPNMMEVESVGDYEKQLQFDSADVPDRPKKKKKAKHLGSSFEHRWQLDSNFQNDQKDHSKRRLDTHQFDSNGSNVSSQMSNMSNPKKFMELLVRDRGRRSKSLKTPAGQPGSGSPWSLFEDQALVVLVHDMGPNWELISDAINSTLQFKCIFRKPKDCKERHKMLMDRNSGDGADSAEDSGSSQPYPSTLPGIPEGSARQLFQRLQGPMEEDTLKSHFEKIIMIGQKKYYRTQNDNQDPKQLQQPHSSHTLALSQVCPNNLNGGPVLTPFELRDTIAPSPDVPPVGYQGPHSGGLPISNQGNGVAMPPGSSSSSSIAGSSNVVLGHNFSSASAPPNPSAREGRYGTLKTGSLSKDDQQRMQQYNQMSSARNLSHTGTDRGVHMLPTGNGIGVMPGINRGMAMARPGFQGMASSSMLNSGSVLSGAGPSQGNSMSRPRDAMHMIRPNPNNDYQRQITPADLQMQQRPPPFTTAPSPSFPNHAPPPPPVPSYPHHHRHQPPPHGPPNPAFGMRLIKERQLQQQHLSQQRLPSIAQNPPTNRPVRNHPQTGNNPITKQQHIFPVAHNFPKSGHGNLYSGPLNPIVQASSKTFSGQTKKLARSSDNNNINNQNQAPSHQKLVNLSQVTSVQRMVNNRVVNSSEPGFNNSPAPCTDATSSETPVGAKWKQLPSS